jgi:hypothetical protein
MGLVLVTGGRTTRGQQRRGERRSHHKTNQLERHVSVTFAPRGKTSACSKCRGSRSKHR